MIRGGGRVASQSIVANAATTTTPISQRTEILPIVGGPHKSDRSRSASHSRAADATRVSRQAVNQMSYCACCSLASSSGPDQSAAPAMARFFMTSLVAMRRSNSRRLFATASRIDGLAPSCEPSLSRTSIRLCQIIHNLAGVRLIDWRTVNLDHLGHLGPPEVFLEFRTPGLGLDIVGRMACRAVVLNNLQIGAGLECRRLIRKLVRDRLGARFGRT